MRLVRTESADSKGPRVDALVVAVSASAHARASLDPAGMDPAGKVRIMDVRPKKLL